MLKTCYRIRLNRVLNTLYFQYKVESLSSATTLAENERARASEREGGVAS